MDFVQIVVAALCVGITLLIVDCWDFLVVCFIAGCGSRRRTGAPE
jgi:hypothetical protein